MHNAQAQLTAMEGEKAALVEKCGRLTRHVEEMQGQMELQLGNIKRLSSHSDTVAREKDSVVSQKDALI